MSLSLSAQTFTTLYTFGSQSYDGKHPQGGVILGPNGTLYCTTFDGGEWNGGTVSEFLPPASPGGAWTGTVIHSFNNQDGMEPQAGLAVGPNGSLYGVAAYYTVDEHLASLAFKLDPPTSASTHWPYTIIFRLAEIDYSALVFGSPSGYGQSLYGTTNQAGSVYRLTPPATAGGAWTQTVLYTFPGGTQGSTPQGSLAVGAANTLFGVTSDGGWINKYCGTAGCGTVFSLTPPTVPGGPWTKQILHSFEPWTGDGTAPFAGVVIGPDGVLYGTTYSGGRGAIGTVFSLTPPVAPGSAMTETILHVFTESAGDGYYPDAALVLGPDGVLYGTTTAGGANGFGTVYQLAPPAAPGGNWTETILHSFTNGADGSAPNGLALGPDGTLYGAAQTGGLNYGTIFALTP